MLHHFIALFAVAILSSCEGISSPHPGNVVSILFIVPKSWLNILTAVEASCFSQDTPNDLNYLGLPKLLEPGNIIVMLKHY